MNNLDHYGGMSLYRQPILPDHFRRQISDMVREFCRATPTITTPWPAWARQILEREYTR